MRIEVTGRQLDVGAALRSRAEEKLQEAVEKYSIRPVEALVTLSKQAHLFTCDCLAHMSTGLTAQASASDTDVYAALDAAVARMEKQLRRHKRRLRDHHQRRKEPIAQHEASTYVLQGEVDDSDADGAEAQESHTPSESQAAGEFWRPAIIAEGKGVVASLSVGEAVMQMELRGESFLLFFNDATNRVNAVYRREDGNIGWIDPTLTDSPKP